MNMKILNIANTPNYWEQNQVIYGSGSGFAVFLWMGTLLVGMCVNLTPTTTTTTTITTITGMVFILVQHHRQKTLKITP